MAKIEQLHNQSHKNVRILRNTDVLELAKQNILPVVLAEFPNAALEFPICFIKNSEVEEYQVVALMGIEREENLFVNGNTWEGSYMPARYTHSPFGLVKNPADHTQFGIAIDIEHRLISESEGERLFNDDGSETEFLQKQKGAMAAYLEQEQLTKLFVKELADADLLVTRSIGVNIGDKKMSVDGVAMVDEEKLKELPDETFLKFRKNGMLPSIYTHLISMRQMNNLMKRKSDRIKAES